MILDSHVRNVNRLLYVLWGSVLAFVLIINIFNSQFENNNTCFQTLETLLPHPVLMFLGWLGLLILFLIISKIWEGKTVVIPPEVSKYYTVLVVSILFFVFQLLLLYNYFFETDWDVQILVDTARQIAYGGDRNANGWYYSMYPNNLFLTQVFSVILFIAKPLHLGNQDIYAIIFVQSMLCVLTAMMLYQLSIKIWNSRAMAVFTYTSYLIMIGLSPWISITYSDAWALPFPILLLWLRLCIDWKGKTYIKWLVITVIAWFGFKIKPQVFFVFVAILLVDGLSYWKETKENRSYKRLFTNYIAPIALGLFIGFGTTFVAEKSIHIRSDQSRNMGAPHFLMMGLNPKTLGSYSDEDIVFSYNFPSQEERAKANLQEAKRRVQQMGIGGFTKLMCQKTLMNYHDGTFYWGQEGCFYKNVFPLKNSHLSPFLRNVYYNNDSYGAYFPWWCTFVTAFWLGVLVLAFFATFGKWNKTLRIIAITILLLTLYECLFEARSRYFFVFVPYFLIMATQGADTLVSWWKRREKKSV